MITMAGFVVVLGLLVDDAVVVAERIIFRKDQGMKGIEAAREGTLDVIRPVIASSITTVLAFSPMLFLGGPAGKFAWAVPAVVVLSLVMSIFESVVMLPLHLSNERKPGVKGKEVKRAFVIKMEAAYRTFLERVVEPTLSGRIWLHRGVCLRDGGYRAACPVYAFPTRRF